MESNPLPRLPLKVVGVVSLFFAIACGCGDAFQEGWDEGMNSSAGDTIAEARASVANCPASTPRNNLNTILDNIEAGVADGSFGGMNANVAGGMVTGATEDGCQDEDIEVVKAVYPELVTF